MMLDHQLACSVFCGFGYNLLVSQRTDVALLIKKVAYPWDGP